MTRRTDTRERILEIAERLLMQVGYIGLSFHEIAAELEVKTAAIHYHFRTKEDLGLASIVRYGARFDAWRASVAHLPPEQRIDAYFDVGRRVVGMGRSCALSLVNAQADVVPASIRQVARDVQERVFGFYCEALDAGRQAGTLQFAGDPASKATEIGCALVGAQQLARIAGPECFERVASQIRRDLVA
jgi:TetR/AcrR family transcriptional repressor of nem operon